MSCGTLVLGGHLSRGTNVRETPAGGTNVTTPFYTQRVKGVLTLLLYDLISSHNLLNQTVDLIDFHFHLTKYSYLQLY